MQHQTDIFIETILEVFRIYFDVSREIHRLSYYVFSWTNETNANIRTLKFIFSTHTDPQEKLVSRSFKSMFPTPFPSSITDSRTLRTAPYFEYVNSTFTLRRSYTDKLFERFFIFI